MPLEDHIPLLDDRRFDDIMTEVRTRIARYAPEWKPGAAAWTDVNDNDPGITLTQVFAWQAEMLLYRMNRVPALNYLKFLQLIGVELKPAEPALAEVSFGVDQNFVDTVVRVPERTQLSADPGDGGPQLIFETTTSLIALRARLDAVVVGDPDVGNTDVTALNTEAARAFQPFGTRAIDGAWVGIGLIDPNPVPAALPAETLNLAVTVARDTRKTQYLSCGFAQTPAYGPAKLVWEFWNGSAWQALTLLKDETLAFTRSGHVYLKLPSAKIPLTAQTKLDPTDATEPNRYWIRARVTKSQYEGAPEIIAVRMNTVAVEQAETIRDEVLGGSDGSRNQRFRLANKPVLKGTLELEIQQSDDGPERWTEVDDFFGSGPADLHYVLNRATGDVFTGDGSNGDIPVAYIKNAGANVVARLYRFGGGMRGNVPAGAISTLVTPVSGIDSSEVRNLAAAYSGRDEETLDQAKKRAPGTLKSRCRAVTADDFEYLAKEAANIRRAKALPLFHPEFPTTRVPGAVSVIVVPDADIKEPRPTPSEGTLRTVCEYLNARRLLTTELFVIKPSYQQVHVSADIVAADNADLAQVHDQIVQQLTTYFHALVGGEDGRGWPFGGTIFYSRVYQRVFTIDGVASITRLQIALDGEAMKECTDVPIALNALLFSAEHEITVDYRFEGTS